MKRLLSIVLVLCMIFSLLCSCVLAEEADYSQVLPGEPMPDFTVTLTDGTVFNLQEALSTHDLVMINIWATWCGPCCREFPVMQEAYAQYSDRVALVCLSPFDDDEGILAFMQENNLTLPLGSDTCGLGDLVYEGYPTTVIVDRYGRYAFYECGSILNVEGFTNMWDTFLSEDYTEDTLITSISGKKYEGEMPTSEQLTQAMGGAVSFACDTENKEVWPFLVDENGVYASSAGVTNTQAALTATVTAEAGDVFALDYQVNMDLMYDLLAVSVNDEIVKYFTGVQDGTYAYRFDEAGDYIISFLYVQDEYADGAEGTVHLSNARILKGEEADQLIASLPTYVYSLAGRDYRLDIMDEGAKQIVIDDPTGLVDDNFGTETTFWIVPAETAMVRLSLGSDWDGDIAAIYGNYDYVLQTLSECECDGTGYVAKVWLSSIEAGGYESTYVIGFADFPNQEGVLAIIFINEENVNYFINYVLAYEDGTPIGASWHYADGTQPATEEVAGAEANLEWTVYMLDENGEPVDGVMLNVCTDETCAPTKTENGVYTFTGDPYPYVIHVLMVPQGYAFDTTQEFVMDEAGDVLVITIPHQ